MSGSFSGPCLVCELEVEADDELGYLSATIKIECSDHGTYPIGTGPYCPGINNVVSSITLDLCGHVAAVTCEPDDTGGT